MKKTNKVNKTVTKEIVEYICCDICGLESEHPNSTQPWSPGLYEERKTELIYREGWLCPDGGSGEEYEIHICPECFVKKLIPWVESHGVSKITPEEWDW